MKIDPPPPFGVFRVGDAIVLTRPPTLPAVEEALREHGSLFAWAGSHPRREALEGRGTLFAAPGPDDGRWVVRHYRRGGAVARLLDDRYLRLGRPRPVREIEASEEAQARGIDTPEVLAAVLRAAGIFYRADIAVRYVPGSSDLARTLFQEPEVGSEARVEACRAAGRLVARLHDAGLVHADLNAKNILLRWTDDPPRPYVLDLDRCRVADEVSARTREKVLSRLGRSLRKWEEESGRPLREREWEAIEEGYREDDGGDRP